MLVPQSARRSVVFLGNVTDGAFAPRGTAFLVRAGGALPGSVLYPHLITAEHVVSGMQQKNWEIFCRINLKDGGVHVTSLRDARWFFHPDTTHPSDVAVTPFELDLSLVDHEYIPLSDRPKHIDRIPRLGEEVFIMGLFKSHYGKERNVPIVRIGNIAALPEEKVLTKYAGYIDAYLIELRSIAGLSGSPVFKNAEGLMPYPRPPRCSVPAFDGLDRE